MITIKKDVKIGKYLIKNVPHLQYEKPTGIKYARNIRVEMNLSEIVAFMEASEWTVYDYERWLHLW